MAAINTCSDFGVVPLFLKCVCVFIVYYNLCIGYLVCFQFLAIVYVQEFRVYGYLDEILSGYVTLFKKYLLNVSEQEGTPFALPKLRSEKRKAFPTVPRLPG